MGRKQLGVPAGRDGSGAAPRPWRRRPRGPAAGLAAAALALAAAALAPTIASGATAGAAASGSHYVYEVCDAGVPGGNSAGATFSGDTRYVRPNDNCAQAGGSLGIYAFQPLSKDTGSESTWTVPIAAPPGASIESLTVSAGTCGASGMSRIFVFEVGWPANCGGEMQRTFKLDPAPELLEVPIQLRCISVCNSGAWVYARQLAARIADPAAPQVAALHGSLFDASPARGHQVVSADVSDRGGGISEARVLVNGEPAGLAIEPPCNVAQVANPSVVGLVAGSPSPCPTRTTLTWTLDTAAHPFRDGSNYVQACATDFSTLSAPNSSCSAARTVAVDNSCPDSPVGNGVSLTARFPRSHREDVTVAFGQSARLNGTLADGQGQPVAGAVVCIQARVPSVPGAGPVVASATTDAGGRFSYRVPAGPNRKLLVAYRHDASQIDRQVRYYAHARPSLKARPRHLRNGKRVRFRGRLPAPNQRGKVVILQANVLGSKRWITFRKATSGKRGVFRASYHFTATARRTVYRFRAIVPNQSSYPWVYGHSRAVRVVVSG